MLTSLRAQHLNTGQISGCVKSNLLQSIAGAAIAVHRQESGVVSRTMSDQSGVYQFSGLIAGQYELIAESSNFRSTRIGGISVHAGQTSGVDIQLTVERDRDVLHVHDRASLLKTSSSDIDDVVPERPLVQLPLNSRHFLQLSLLSDGVVRPPGGTRGSALQQAGDLVNVAGQRSGHNIYLVDGAKVTDEYFNNLVLSPSIDAIQEFRIQKSLYSAQYGGKASALINVVTKSGSNSLHGSLFEFLRNSKLDAKNYFADPHAPIPPFQQNQFGAAFGGPVVIPHLYRGQNRTFFFLSYEGHRIRKSETQTFSVPTASMKNGRLTDTTAAYDPLSTGADGQRIPFSGNTLPMNRIDPIAQSLLAAVPQPNLPGSVQNYRAVEKQRTNVEQGNARIDHIFSERDRIFGRFSMFRADAFQPFGSTVLNETLVPGFGRYLSTHTINGITEYQRTFGSRTMNTLRIAYLGVSGGQSSENAGVDFAARTGLLGTTSNPQDMGYPSVSFGGQFSSIGDPTTFVSRKDRSFEITENLLLQRGRHTLSIGSYLYFLRFNPVNAAAARGAYSFTNRWTTSCAQVPGCSSTGGNALAEMLLGYPTSANVGVGRADEHGRSRWIHAYIQDNWRVSSNLTLNLGLRWEYNGQMSDRDYRLSLVDFLAEGGARFVIASDGNGNIHPSAQTLLPLIPVPYTTSAALGWSPSLLTNSTNRFSPRVGLAWRPHNSSNLVIRTGFGIHQNQWAYSVQQSLASNLPFFANKTVTTSAGSLTPNLTTRDILTTSSLGTIGGSTMMHAYRPEYNVAWSFSIQGLIRDVTWELGYFGSRINYADNTTILNVPRPGPGSIDARRPVRELGNVSAIRWDGWSRYNSLRARIEKRAVHGLYLLASYTWSKSIDDASDPGSTEYESNIPQDVYSYQTTERALSSFDHRHRVTATALYDFSLRQGPSIFQHVLKSWQIAGIFTAQTGAPFTVNLGTDHANVGPGPAQRPDTLRDPNSFSNRTPEQWFDTSAFALPAAFTFGNLGRNTVFAPGEVGFDASLKKAFVLPRESARLLFHADVFNVINRPNFGVPNRIAFTPNFGRIFSARDARQIQFGLKLIF